MMSRDYLIELIKRDEHYLVETYLRSMEQYKLYKDEPLYFYAISNRMAKILWKNNINPEVTDEFGQTAFYHKPASLFKGMTEFLNLEHKDRYGNTLLMHTVMYEDGNSFLKVKELLAGGADPNCRNFMEQTPLFYCQSMRILKELLKAGADPHALDAHGNNIILYNMNPTVINHLLNTYSYNINHQNHDGNTALHTQNNRLIYGILIEHNIDPTIRNNYGHTVLLQRILKDPLLREMTSDMERQK